MIDTTILISLGKFKRAPEPVQQALALWCIAAFPETNLMQIECSEDGTTGRVTGVPKNPAPGWESLPLGVDLRFPLRVPKIVRDYCRDQ